MIRPRRVPDLCLLLWLACCPLLRAAESSTVDSLLRALQPLGIDVIYSSELVPADLPAPAPRAGRTPLEQAVDALAAHGLKLEPLAAQKYVVVRMPPAPPPEPESSASLQEISVYASRYSIEGRLVAEPRELTSSDIDVVPGSHDDALRALKSLPGLASNASGRPYIRGSLADDVLVRYDGITLLDPFHLKNFQSLISAIDPAGIERIEVFSGGFPVRYGTRSGGVIDITPPASGAGYENRAALSLISAGVSSARQQRTLAARMAGRPATQHARPARAGRGRRRQAAVQRFARPAEISTEHGAWTWAGCCSTTRSSCASPTMRRPPTTRYRDEYLWLARDHDSATGCACAPPRCSRPPSVIAIGLLDQPGVAMGSLDDRIEFDRTELTNVWTFERSNDVTDTFGAEFAVSEADYRYLRTADFAPAVAAAFDRPLSNDLAFQVRPKALTYALHVAKRRQWKSFEAELGLRLDAQHYDRGGRSHAVESAPEPALRHERAIARLRIGGPLLAGTTRRRMARRGGAGRSQTPRRFRSTTILGVTYEPSRATRWASRPTASAGPRSRRISTVSSIRCR